MVSVIIPVYNQHEMTRECLDAVYAYTRDCEVIVIDNGSNPPLDVRGTIIRNEKNLGFPKAVNQGIRAAKGDTIILLNNDVIVTPGWADLLARRLFEFSIVGPCTNYVAGKQRADIGFYDNRESLDQEAGFFTEEHSGEVEEVNWVIGFCMAFRKLLYNELGEFDESLWPCSGEEIDFCFRARKEGFRVGIAKDVYVHHEGSQTFMDMEKAGKLKYSEVCNASDQNIASRWGADFWRRQGI